MCTRIRESCELEEALRKRRTKDRQFFEEADVELFTNDTGLAEGTTEYVGADTVRVDKAGYVVHTAAVEFTGVGDEFILAVSLVPEV